MEIYSEIKDYEELYEVSTLGNVRNIKTNRVLIPNFDGYYYNVNLSKNGKQRTIRIHRLVAIAFLENPNEYKCIDHINLNKLDNRVDNLRWVSYSINMFNIDKRKKNNCSSKYKGVCFDKRLKKFRAYICINKNIMYLGLYENEIDAAIKYNEKAMECITELIKINNIDII